MIQLSKEHPVLVLCCHFVPFGRPVCERERKCRPSRCCAHAAAGGQKIIKQSFIQGRGCARQHHVQKK
eukprot:3611968-Rhodomonas_salina.2